MSAYSYNYYYLLAVVISRLSTQLITYAGMFASLPCQCNNVILSETKPFNLCVIQLSLC